MLLTTALIYLTILSILTGISIHRIKFHPLSHIPGPWFASLSPLFLYIICYFGIEGRVTRYYHQKYNNTTVLRVGPNSVSVSNSAAIHDIYVANGGFVKDVRYRNFNMGPVVSIFSAVDVEYRNRRAKAVAPMFAPVRLRKAGEADGVIGRCVSELVEQLSSFKKKKKKKAGKGKLDILDLCARCSIDVVTGYLLGERYGGLDEDLELRLRDGSEEDLKLSANPFIFAIVAFARFSLLPNWLFQYVYAVSSRLNSTHKIKESLRRLDEFAQHVTVGSSSSDPVGSCVKQDKTSSMDRKDDLTYQARLLEVGISPAEAATQAQATIFAGADSTAVMLATILFHLVQNPSARTRLFKEIRTTNTKPQGSTTTDDTDASSSPVGDRDRDRDRGGGNFTTESSSSSSSYLRAVVKEGLRLGMANPTRLTRVVPARGLRIGDIYVPSGTIVGCAAYILHHDPVVFPEPFQFRPERWMETNPCGLQRPDMNRNLMPFGAGLRACIGKNLALQQLHDAVRAVVDSEVLEGAKTCQDRIEVTEWFNGEIKDHRLDISWS